jgi:hypothetical protein
MTIGTLIENDVDAAALRDSDNRVSVAEINANH